jgi:serine/threonine-protein kinase
MEPVPGMMVTSNIRLESLLGEGGMGSVWVATHQGLGTKVAIKFISTDVARKCPELLERFRREAGTAARIKSPHVVQIFDHGLTADGTPYIAMELLEGESLHDRLQRDGTMAPRDLGMLLAQTAQALSKAHAMGIVHRDIKPANMVLLDAGYAIFVKLLDFGIAKQADMTSDLAMTTTGSLLGSPLYMSPEQLLNPRDVDRRADLWSLAVVAYQALTGYQCFPGDTAAQVMLSVTTRQYRPPTNVCPGISPALDAFFAKAFHGAIDLRFQSADDLAKAFLAAIGESDAAAGPPLSSVGSRTAAAPPPPAPAPHVGLTLPGAPLAEALRPAVTGDPGTFAAAAATWGGSKASRRTGVVVGIGAAVACLVIAAAAFVGLRGRGSDEPAAAAPAPEAVAEPSARAEPAGPRAGTDAPSAVATATDPARPEDKEVATASTQTSPPTASSTRGTSNPKGTAKAPQPPSTPAPTPTRTSKGRNYGW